MQNFQSPSRQLNSTIEILLSCRKMVGLLYTCKNTRPTRALEGHHRSRGTLVLPGTRYRITDHLPCSGAVQTVTIPFSPFPPPSFRALHISDRGQTNSEKNLNIKSMFGKVVKIQPSIFLQVVNDGLSLPSCRRTANSTGFSSSLSQFSERNFALDGTMTTCLWWVSELKATQ